MPESHALPPSIGSQIALIEEELDTRVKALAECRKLNIAIVYLPHEIATLQAVLVNLLVIENENEPQSFIR